MAKYRKKPVVIEAVQFDGSEQSVVGILSLGGSRLVKPDCGGKELIIVTLEGNMKANINDYIIKGVKGELYPCKPDIFEATYEAVE